MVKIVTGIRRSGKSFLLFTLFREYLRKEGVKEDRIVSLSRRRRVQEGGHRQRAPFPLVYRRESPYNERLRFPP
ncbi:MAG: AAA family ATPase [Thermoguttaceae bacterium]|nr:AAA family ATPase [Thermoguttaceae bacterium]